MVRLTWRVRGHSARVRLGCWPGSQAHAASQSPVIEGSFRVTIASPMQHFYIHTFGCQMNVHDSQRMAGILRDQGMLEVLDPDAADLIVVNTCSVREKAEVKLDSELGQLKRLKKRSKHPVLAVAGCVARQRGQAIIDRMPYVDIVLGPDRIQDLPALARAAADGAPPVVHIAFDIDSPSFLQAGATAAAGAPSAFVAISKGCDERCSFCIVPSTRGPERHRPADEIVAEVAALVTSGTREVVLLGQTVNGYRDPSGSLSARARGRGITSSDFPALLRRITEQVPALARLRYTSPHPRYFDRALADAHKDLDVLCRHVHMPVQSGSDAVLRRMLRRHTREEYLESVRMLRNARPDMTFGTDLIVGFPGETEEDFQQTLSLMREVRFTGVFAFKYSRRPGTAALALDGEPSDDVKSDRLGRLFELADDLLAEHFATLVGSVQQVLVEEKGPRRDGRLSGRTERNEIVHIADADARLGEIVQVRIERAFRHSLEGTIVRSGGGSPTRPRRLPIVSTEP